MIELYPVRAPKSVWQRVPEAERTFYFMAGSAANDLNMLGKQLLAFTAVGDQGGPQNMGNSAFAMLIARMLTGRIIEAAKVVRDDFKPIRDSYLPKLPKTARDAHDLVVSALDSGGQLQRIRNKLAFHADAPPWRAAFDLMPDNAEMTDYQSSYRGNLLYGSAEMVHLYTFEDVFGTGNIHASIETWRELLFDTVASFNDFFNEFASRFTFTHFDITRARLEREKLVLNTITSDEIRPVPFFFEMLAPAEDH